MDSLFVVMPAYNEEENVEGVVKQWYPILSGKDEKSRLVIADSGSTDKTHERLKILQREYPKLEILTETQKQHGPKVIALYDYAIKQGATYVFQTDSDGQTDPAEFDGFWRNREKYDGIFGYRNAREDGKIRDFVEKIVCFLLRIYFGIKVPDANAPFRLMKVETVKKYLYRIPSDYHIPNIIMTTFFVYYNEKTLFKTISFYSRQGGENSINFLSIIKTGWKALGDFKRLRKEMRR